MVIRGDLVDSALHYANGFPLALEVLGTFLCGRTECERESALNKLAKSPDKTINDVLKISYDGLEDYAKEIFLDIACFFKGRHTKYIMKVLDSCDFDTTIGVQVLVEKSLIIEENGTLHMHDLIQLMGMDIVKQECRDDPGRRSRLWLFDDVQDVLSRDRVTNAVKAIVLDLAEPEEIYMGPNAFANMRRLRVLIMNNVHNSFQGLICLPNELRWFEWPECPPWIPEFSSGPKKLVGLDLHKSNIQIVKEQFKDFKKLKFIYFSECQSLVCMPDLYCTPNLEVLDLHGCKNLKHGHESVAYHGKLQLLNLSGCSELRHLSDVLQAKNLQFLYLHDCSKLQTFPDILVEIKGIRELDMVGTSIKELPASIKNLVSVEEMNLMDNKELAVLLSSIYSLQNLKTLTLAGCSKLVKFPNKEDSSDPPMKTGFPELWWLDLCYCNLSEVNFLENQSSFPSLRKLLLSGNNFTNLPTCGQLYKLLSLDFSHAQPLKEIFKFPENLRHVFHLDAADLSSCHELVPSGFTMNDLFKPEVPISKSYLIVYMYDSIFIP
ncbi:TMV resistance protein N isoform X2 [Eucalyptus grandis]|uniref:TMV resistance protein N isoform X2 n=1 Tax=Eucalyptus grandis TaxID=71139 RepID=UPI0008A0C042|nr:TMV resistance protein N isoform X2 [Eucalyptus grandis]